METKLEDDVAELVEALVASLKCADGSFYNAVFDLTVTVSDDSAVGVVRRACAKHGIKEPL